MLNNAALARGNERSTKRHPRGGATAPSDRREDVVSRRGNLMICGRSVQEHASSITDWERRRRRHDGSIRLLHTLEWRTVHSTLPAPLFRNNGGDELVSHAMPQSRKGTGHEGSTLACCCNQTVRQKFAILLNCLVRMGSRRLRSAGCTPPPLHGRKQTLTGALPPIRLLLRVAVLRETGDRDVGWAFADHQTCSRDSAVHGWMDGWMNGPEAQCSV
jgi:hypothetical protein